MGDVIDIDKLILKDKVNAILAGNGSATMPLIAQRLGVSESEVARCLPEGRSTELDATGIMDLIREFEPLGKVRVIVQNGRTVLETNGQFGGYSATGPYLNVRTDTLDLRIDTGGFTTAFALVNPGRNEGIETASFEFFAADCKSSFKVILAVNGNKEAPERFDQFKRLRARYALLSCAIKGVCRRGE